MLKLECTNWQFSIKKIPQNISLKIWILGFRSGKKDRRRQPARPSEKNKILDFQSIPKLSETVIICGKCELPSSPAAHQDIGELKQCRGVCSKYFHSKCFPAEFAGVPVFEICSNCTRGFNHCFDCGELIMTQRGIKDPTKPPLPNIDKDIICGENNCGKYYHLSCILKHKYSKVILTVFSHGYVFSFWIAFKCKRSKYDQNLRYFWKHVRL